MLFLSILLKYLSQNDECLTKPCLQESEELPKDFQKLFNDTLFKFDTNLIPEAVALYEQVSIPFCPRSYT